MQLALPLVLAWAALAVPHAVEATQHLQPLDPVELGAIEAEAAARERASHRDPPQEVPAWHTLTPDKLQRAIASGQLQGMGPFQGQGQLVDQAMAWDLVHFQTPSDIKRFFQRVHGKDFFAEPEASARDDNGPGIGYYTDASASAEGGALSALYNCMPVATWDVESTDPVLWLMARGDNLDVPNTQDFRKCVRQQRDDTTTPDADDPETTRGVQSARIIEDRLSRQLLAHGCRATGPDQCLGLLRALTALDPAHPALARIARKLDREVDAASPAALPMPTTPGSLDMHDPAQAARYRRLQDDLWRRGIVLSAELDQMRRVPHAWSARERRRGIDAAITLMFNQRKLDWMVNPMGFHNAREYPFANPWDHLSSEGQPAPEVVQRLAELGDAAAGTASGCAFAKLRWGGAATGILAGLWAAEIARRA